MQTINQGRIPPRIISETGDPPRKNKFQIGDWVRHRSDSRYQKLLVVDFDVLMFDSCVVEFVRWVNGRRKIKEMEFLNTHLEKVENES